MAQETDLQKAWGFVADYYPDYSGSSEIAESDLLQRVVDLEFDPEDQEDSAYKEFKQIAEELEIGIPADEEIVIAEAQVRMNKLNSKIYERSIVEYLDSKKPPLKIHFLFGSDAITTLHQDGIDSLEMNFDTIGGAVFEWIEGETTIMEFAEASDGWLSNQIISEDWYLTLLNAK